MDPKTSFGLAIGVKAHAELVSDFHYRMFSARARKAEKSESNHQSDEQIKRLVLVQMIREHAPVLEEEHCRTVWELFLESFEAD